MQTFIVAAKRTPFGKFGGKFKNISAIELGAVASRAALQALPEEFQARAAAKEGGASAISSVIFGNVQQTSRDGALLPRHIGLKAGLPIEVPALGVNRLCGSGFQSIISGVQEIKAGDSSIVLAGGAESMSQAPYVLRNARWGTQFGHESLPLEDSLVTGLTDTYPTRVSMGVTAENLGRKYNISREQADQFALSSQQKWKKADETNQFADELVPVEVPGKKGTTELMNKDEHPRPATTIEGLTQLKPTFEKNGTVNPGNASGICDGAAALVVASEEACSTHNLKPLARIVSYHYNGVDPTIMGIGPVEAIRQALAKANLTLKDMDFVEVNEAFATQALAVAKCLDIDMSKFNVNGGAIALGHPLGASGARIMTHLTHLLVRTKKRYAIGSACIGGGQGIAIVIENATL
ncbi:3-ketoacyl-CoA thiolase, mitochondrial [Zancudomyces culisetae]|uniref:3-ketoacyl-CoA thiolase, mitochondrial n=1 Tax=Zancudomyces culisetae TaxID=1213189 RepID=A0A1R1PWL9_ZANCU|nr:3-ketoacyl-CoA thiolase, mitochondrial [Zancudomyces culisetae]|eukprot:OMH85282.1 3-ketoacyl-CoA thiolase, mitochondrial [Zancudomyces culisetae]